jgi:dihydrofolate reductase
MRKIINSTYISLDGVVEQPHLWPTIDRPKDDRATKIQTDLVLACDVVLMGRRTYEGFAPAWQARAGDPMSDRINTMPKVVVSTTLTDPDWANTTVISGDVVERVRELKAEPGQDIVQYGFGSVSTLLMLNGLIDELRWWVHPFFVGAGSADDLIFPKAPPTQFELVDSAILKSSMVILTYRLATEITPSIRGAG